LRIVRDLPPERYEFQMLLGVRPDRADELVAAGHRLRVYVPYGTHWYQYSVRRLQENPKMAGYVANLWITQWSQLATAKGPKYYGSVL
jgi:proline dehydrogenase